MPLPTPNSGESEDDFIGRCMANDTAKADFPDQKQRLAVCFSQWRTKKEGKAMELFPRIPDEYEIRHVGSYGEPMDLESRAADGDASPSISGTGIVFGKPSLELGSLAGNFREIIKPSAVDAALEGSDMRSIFNHNPDNLLGRESAGTMRVAKARGGVRYEVDLQADDPLHMRVHGMVQRREVTGSSFVFTVAKDGDKWTEEDGIVTRTVTRMASIMSMEPVVFPAYESTRVSARSLESAKRFSFEVMEHLEAYAGAMQQVVDELVDGELARA